MRDAAFDRGRVTRYLIWTFALAWAVQAGAALLYRSGHVVACQLVMSGMMFIPTLGVRLAGARFGGMGWRPGIRKNLRVILIAWFGPALLTAIGAALYFLVFPGHFDLTGSGMAAGVGREALEQMRAQGVTYPVYVLIAIAGCLTYAPLVNTFVSLGEEIGWRGFLYPQLKARFGRRKGWLLGGAIWGAWHWPLIWWIGYEYGTAYAGFPVIGMLLFCAVTVAWGILCDWLYEISGSIWLPSIFHGAINAAATVPLAVCLDGTGSARLLGPAPNGLLAGLPLIAVAVALWLRGNDPRATR